MPFKDYALPIFFLFCLWFFNQRSNIKREEKRKKEAEEHRTKIIRSRNGRKI